MINSMGDAISYDYILQCMYVVEVCLTSLFVEYASVLERLGLEDVIRLVRLSRLMIDVNFEGTVCNN